MPEQNKKDVYLNNKDADNALSNVDSNPAWSRKETKQVLGYFILAFVLVLLFGFLVNYYLL